MFKKLTLFNFHLKFLRSSPFQIKVFLFLANHCMSLLLWILHFIPAANNWPDQYQYLGNFPPTPPLTQQQSIDYKLGVMLG